MYIETPYIGSHMGHMDLETPYIYSHMGPMYIETPCIYTWNYVKMYFDLRLGQKCHSKWCTGRKWHIPMASNRKRSRGRIKADNMGQSEGPTVPLQSDASEECDLSTAWQLFPLDDDQTCHSKDRVGDWVGVELL